MDMMLCPLSFTLVWGLDGELQSSKKINQSRIQIKKRALILNAAEHVFARHGFSGSRLKEIAEEAGLPAGHESSDKLGQRYRIDHERRHWAATEQSSPGRC